MNDDPVDFCASVRTPYLPSGPRHELTFGEIGDLMCPRCGEGNLHQDLVRVWRRQEDSDGDLVSISAADAGQQPERSFVAEGGFPHTRRQSIEIVFTCENCTGPHVLAIYQRKGVTYLTWGRGC